MVRYVNPPPEGIAYSDSSPFKSSICQPKDNIGISCVFSKGTATQRDKPSTGIRRKYAVPKDNLGVACLPSTESVGLRDIPEVSEYGSSEEIYRNTNGHNYYRILITKFSNNLFGGAEIAQVRLRAGEDGDQIQSRSATCRESKIDRIAHFKPKGNIDFIDESERLIIPSKKIQPKSTSLDIGISNIRRPKHDPMQPRKLIVPKDNIGFSGRHLQKSLIRSSGSKTSVINNQKKISRESEKNYASSAKSLSNLSEKRIATQTKSLKANRLKPEL